MANIQPTFFPEAGSLSVMMADGDGYISLASDASIVTATSSFPPGVTVAKTGTGVYTLTFSCPFNKIFVTPTFQTTTAAGVALYAQNGSVTATTAEIRLVNGSGAATNPAAACGITFHVRMKVSTVLP